MSGQTDFDFRELATFLKKRDSPPTWSFFFISAFYCEKGLLGFFIQAALDVWMRLRHGPRSVAASKVALTCLARKVSGLLMRPTDENLEQARKLLQQAKAQYPQELLAPVHSLEGKILLLHLHPPRPEETLQAYERCLAILPHSPYLALLSQPHTLFFCAAMAAVLMKDHRRAAQYYDAYECFVSGKPRKRWDREQEQDLTRRIQALPKPGS